MRRRIHHAALQRTMADAKSLGGTRGLSFRSRAVVHTAPPPSPGAAQQASVLLLDGLPADPALQTAVRTAWGCLQAFNIAGASTKLPYCC